MYDIDYSQAFLLVEARNQLARNAIGLEANAAAFVLPKQNLPIQNAPPSVTASQAALQLRLDSKPIDLNAGYVFGSSEEDCDILLDTQRDRGVSSKAFSIGLDKNQAVILTCLARNDIFFHQESQNPLPRSLKKGGLVYLEPQSPWIISLGSIQIALKVVRRDHWQQQAYDRNFKDYDRAVSEAKKHKSRAPAATTKDTPATRVLTGIRGIYTIADNIGEGVNGTIAACTTKTGVTCCIKRPKASGGRGTLKREIRWLRSFAHPSIVQYIDRDEDYYWMAMEFAEGGTLSDQLDFETFSVREAEVIIYQALDALSHIHSFGIIHHDMKFPNILVKLRTENQILIKVADFGGSRHLSDQSDTLRGTAYYYAPECFKERPRSWGTEIDVWALAMVALELLYELPDEPRRPQNSVEAVGPRSPYANGWGGALNAQMAAYARSKPRVSGHLLQTLSHMFDSDPRTRIRASVACQNLREGYEPGYFLSLGKDRVTPTTSRHVLGVQADARANEESIFRFRKLEVEGLSKPLLMLEGCYLINIQQLLEATPEPEVDIEVATYEVLKELEHRCWRFKQTHRLPETYIRLEHALELCKQKRRLRQFFHVLQEQKDLCDKAMAGFEDEDYESGGPSMPQLALIESISTPDHVIAITQEGRMVLVRATDGTINLHSIEAVRTKSLLSKDAIDDEIAYVPIEQAWRYLGTISHDDIISLGAATYSSY